MLWILDSKLGTLVLEAFALSICHYHHCPNESFIIARAACDRYIDRQADILCFECFINPNFFKLHTYCTITQ